MDNISIETIWFDENIQNKENKRYFKQLKSIFKKSSKYQLLDEGFDKLYKRENENDFVIIISIVSGKLFGRYIQKIKDNINKIINIPYTFIFTSTNYKKILLNEIPDINHILSYDTKIAINHGFYNPGGVYDDFDQLIFEIKNKILGKNIIDIEERRGEKINYEGVLTFEYLQSEEDLLAPALYKDIITNEKITEEDCDNFHKFLLTFNDDKFNFLINNLNMFKNIPFQILSKYWARCYTIESQFYRQLNNKLMHSELPPNYKTFIKMLYTGVEMNSLNSYTGKYLYRGSTINKIEIERIKEYRKKGKLSNVIVFSKAFLSFSEDKNSAKNFCGNSDNTKIGCLYILENNNINLHESNADIQLISVYPKEKEILFFPGSSFIIKNIEYFDENKIEIILNYNGKFKEKYSLIYDDHEKINDLIKNNELTKNIAGKKLEFIKSGRYLKEKRIGIEGSGEMYRGKDLKTDENIVIKQVEKSEMLLIHFTNEVDLLKKISKKIEHSPKYRDHFESQGYYYIILNNYEDTLEDFLKRKKNLPINLINKIFNQLNITLKELINNHIVHRDIKPSNILIKYTNDEKTNFDSILTGYAYSREYYEGFSMNSKIGTNAFMAPEILKGDDYSNSCDLFSIGVIMYYLFFGKFPHNEDYIRRKIYSDFKIKEDYQFEDLIKQLLKENPKERITWEEYFEHPFFKQYKY